MKVVDAVIAQRSHFRRDRTLLNVIIDEISGQAGLQAVAKEKFYPRFPLTGEDVCFLGWDASRALAVTDSLREAEGLKLHFTRRGVAVVIVFQPNDRRYLLMHIVESERGHEKVVLPWRPTLSPGSAEVIKRSMVRARLQIQNFDLRAREAQAPKNKTE